MAQRFTVYNNITSEEKLKECNPKNLELHKDFLDYLKSIDRAKSTIAQYDNDLNIFWCWNYEFNNNKNFTDITKREFARFQSHTLSEWGWSPKRVRRVKSVLSSLSSYIENILDEEEEYAGYRSIVKKIESPVNEPVRDKTIITDEEVNTILDTLVDEGKYRAACAFALAAFSGSRKSELLRFKVSYFDDCNIMPDAALYCTPEKIKTKGRGANGKMLNKYTLLDFKKYLDLWMNERKQKETPDSEYIFCDVRTGELCDISMFDNVSKKITEILGRPFYFHALRHQLCTRLFKIGLPGDVIQEFFGWSSPEMLVVYRDTSATDSFGKFFTNDGIKGSDTNGLSDL